MGDKNNIAESVVLDGFIVDIAREEKVAVFSSAKNSSGVIGLRDIVKDSSSNLVEEMLNEIGINIVKEFSELKKD